MDHSGIKRAHCFYPNGVTYPFWSFNQKTYFLGSLIAQNTIRPPLAFCLWKKRRRKRGGGTLKYFKMFAFFCARSVQSTQYYLPEKDVCICVLISNTVSKSNIWTILSTVKMWSPAMDWQWLWMIHFQCFVVMNILRSWPLVMPKSPVLLTE